MPVSDLVDGSVGELKMKLLPDHWVTFLKAKAETGMGYVVASVRLRDGKEYPQVVIDCGFVTRVCGFDSVPFDPLDIVHIDVTHEKWDWNQDGG